LVEATDPSSISRVVASHNQQFAFFDSIQGVLLESQADFASDLAV
jgi:hypothetical protein